VKRPPCLFLPPTARWCRRVHCTQPFPLPLSHASSIYIILSLPRLHLPLYSLSPLPSPATTVLLPVCFGASLPHCAWSLSLSPHLLHLPHSATARAEAELPHQEDPKKKPREASQAGQQRDALVILSRYAGRCSSSPTSLQPARSCSGDFLGPMGEAFLHREVVALAVLGIQAGARDQSAGCGNAVRGLPLCRWGTGAVERQLG
jgi:hypothetical protein